MQRVCLHEPVVVTTCGYLCRNKIRYCTPYRHCDHPIYIPNVRVVVTTHKKKLRPSNQKPTSALFYYHVIMNHSCVAISLVRNLVILGIVWLWCLKDTPSVVHCCQEKRKCKLGHISNCEIESETVPVWRTCTSMGRFIL